MERGLYIAASGMLAQQVRQDQIANDLANASTPGYKADRAAQASFEDMLLQNSQTGETVGSMSMGAHVARIVTSLQQGPLQQTGDPLDIALQGDGFLAVSTGSRKPLHPKRAALARQPGPAHHRHRLPRPRARTGSRSPPPASERRMISPSRRAGS